MPYGESLNGKKVTAIVAGAGSGKMQQEIRGHIDTVLLHDAK